MVYEIKRFWYIGSKPYNSKYNTNKVLTNHDCNVQWKPWNITKLCNCLKLITMYAFQFFIIDLSKFLKVLFILVWYFSQIFVNIHHPVCSEQDMKIFVSSNWCLFLRRSWRPIFFFLILSYKYYQRLSLFSFS